MPDPVLLSEAKAFLRVTHDEEDALITTFLAAAKARLENETGLELDESAAHPLRLALLYLVAQAYDRRGEGETGSEAFRAWMSSYRRVRL